jgi:endogenous inhibitor of DNA gyrase (YacG/DUF329 family)
MLMEMITINCPYCGGQVTRNRYDYFANCPYCGREIAFDEIKEEAELDLYRDRIVELQHNNSAFEQNRRQEEESRQKLRRCIKRRNIAFTVMTLMHGLGFAIVGGVQDEDSDLMVIGVTLLMAAWGTLIASVILLPLAYPSYNYLTGENRPVNRFSLFLKLTVTAIALCTLSLLVGFIVLAILGLI